MRVVVFFWICSNIGLWGVFIWYIFCGWVKNVIVYWKFMLIFIRIWKSFNFVFFNNFFCNGFCNWFFFFCNNKRLGSGYYCVFLICWGWSIFGVKSMFVCWGLRNFCIYSMFCCGGLSIFSVYSRFSFGGMSIFGVYDRFRCRCRRKKDIFVFFEYLEVFFLIYVIIFYGLKFVVCYIWLVWGNIMWFLKLIVWRYYVLEFLDFFKYFC